mmetsp:Transcript_33133/g.74828  ORF Transcript_33133/g.74828 Transcript_33133/m.74828 type:complete len:265 (+) Transcript_33133:635-1429(+)
MTRPQVRFFVPAAAARAVGCARGRGLARLEGLLPLVGIVIPDGDGVAVGMGGKNLVGNGVAPKQCDAAAQRVNLPGHPNLLSRLLASFFFILFDELGLVHPEGPAVRLSVPALVQIAQHRESPAVPGGVVHMLLKPCAAPGVNRKHRVRTLLEFAESPAPRAELGVHEAVQALEHRLSGPHLRGRDRAAVHPQHLVAADPRDGELRAHVAVLADPNFRGLVVRLQTRDLLAHLGHQARAQELVADGAAVAVERPGHRRRHRGDP